MEHSFLQKLILVALVGAIAAAFYVYVYKGLIEGADNAINKGYHKPGTHATPAPTPRRY